jgi:hypothetical protein
MAAGNRDGDEAREASWGREVVGIGEVVELGAELENIWVVETTDELLYGKAVVARGADVVAEAAEVINWVAEAPGEVEGPAEHDNALALALVHITESDAVTLKMSTAVLWQPTSPSPEQIIRAGDILIIRHQ